jgi:hypothetical protein
VCACSPHTIHCDAYSTHHIVCALSSNESTLIGHDMHTISYSISSSPGPIVWMPLGGPGITNRPLTNAQCEPDGTY